MLEHCDFEEQKTVVGDDGYLRPDMIVHLPGGGQVVIDSKVPLDAFLQYIEADDDDAPRCCWRSTPSSCAPTSTSWRRRSTGSSSTARPSSSWPSSRVSRCWPPPSTPIRHCKSTRWTSGSSWPRRTPWWPRCALSPSRGSRRRWPRTPARCGTWGRNSTSAFASGRDTCRRSRRASPRASTRTTAPSARSSQRVLVTARKFPSLGVVGGEHAEITELTPIESAPRHLQSVWADDEDDESGAVQQNILPLPDSTNTGPRSERRPG